MSSTSSCTITASGSVASSPIQACSSLPSDSRSSSAHSGEQACGAERNRRRLHLSCVGRSSAPSRTPSARIGSVVASSPSTCCSRVVSVNKAAPLKARRAPECVDGSSSDLQRELQRTVLQFRFEVRQHGCERPRSSACLRRALVWIFALANGPTD